MHLVEANFEHGRFWGPKFYERRFPRGHLNYGTTQRPDVRGSSISSLSLVNDLWSHVLKSACECDSAGADACQPLAGAKIRYFDHPAVGVDQHVVPLDVPVD